MFVSSRVRVPHYVFNFEVQRPGLLGIFFWDFRYFSVLVPFTIGVVKTGKEMSDGRETEILCGRLLAFVSSSAGFKLQFFPQPIPLNAMSGFAPPLRCCEG